LSLRNFLEFVACAKKLIFFVACAILFPILLPVASIFYFLLDGITPVSSLHVAPFLPKQ
jgi:hypothetical protein